MAGKELVPVETLKGVEIVFNPVAKKYQATIDGFVRRSVNLNRLKKIIDPPKRNETSLIRVNTYHPGFTTERLNWYQIKLMQESVARDEYGKREYERWIVSILTQSED